MGNHGLEVRKENEGSNWLTGFTLQRAIVMKLACAFSPIAATVRLIFLGDSKHLCIARAVCHAAVTGITHGAVAGNVATPFI